MNSHPNDDSISKCFFSQNESMLQINQTRVISPDQSNLHLNPFNFINNTPLQSPEKLQIIKKNSLSPEKKHSSIRIIESPLKNLEKCENQESYLKTELIQEFPLEKQPYEIAIENPVNKGSFIIEEASLNKQTPNKNFIEGASSNERPFTPELPMLFSARLPGKADFLEDYHYKSQDDLSKYLNSRFHLKASLEKKETPMQLSNSSIAKQEKKEFLMNESKESSIKQIEIDENVAVAVNNEGDLRLSEGEIKKYVMRLYFLMNFKALKFFSMIVYAAVVFLYDFPVISIVYGNLPLEAYNICYEIRKWKKDVLITRKKKWVFLAEILLFLSSHMIAIIYVTIGGFGLNLSILPLYMLTFMRCFFPSEKNSNAEYATFLDFVTLFWRIFVALQATTISFKIDSMINWQWNEVFWLYWVLFAFLLGFNLGLLLIIANKWLKGLENVADCNEMKGMAWIFSICLSLTISSALLVLGIIHKLDKNSDDKLYLSFYFTIICLLINGILSLLLSRGILDFFQKIALSEQEELDNESSGQISKEDIQNNIAMPLRIPKFLEKLSNSYFRPAESKKHQKPTKLDTLEVKTGHKKVIYKGKRAIYPKNFKPDPSKSKISSFSITKTNVLANNPIKQKKPFQNIPQIKKMISEKSQKQESSLASLNLNENYQEKRSFSLREPDFNLKSIEEEEKAVEYYSEKEKPSKIYHNTQNFFTSEEIQSKIHQKDNQKQMYFHTLDEVPSKILQKETPTEENPPKTVKKDAPNDKDSINAPQTCLICFDNESDAVIMHCGHGGVCYTCCIALWRKNQGCYLCRKPISQVLQVDLKVPHGDKIKVISCTKMKKH